MGLKLGGESIEKDDSIPIVVTTDMEIKSYVKGYHVYKNEMEPYDIKDYYLIVNHLPLAKIESLLS